MKPISFLRLNSSRALVLALFAQLFVLGIFAQPAPKDVLGFTPGDDYKLAHWAKIVEYFQKLDASSDRVVFKEIGKTTMGKPFVYALISSPANLKKLDYYKGINDKLADPRLIKRSEKEAARLIKLGKTFVLITHGIHSTEVGSTLSSTLIAHQLATSKDKRITNILDNTIIVMVPSLNPDGVDIVKDWYDKTLGTKFEGTSPPELYHKYVGHDNNRDWYAFTQVETQLTVEKIHNVYHPQIVHDIHQQGTNGARYFIPPYLDPVEPNVPQEIIDGYSEMGSYMAAQMRKDGKQGITTNSTYDAWTPARAYSHYHGGARILSETASARLASPIEIDFGKMSGSRGFDAKKESDNYGPLWKGGKWTIGDITNYMTTGAFHLLDHAANNRAKWLSRFNKIGFDATRPRKEGELNGYLIEYSSNLYSALKRAGVEVKLADEFEFEGTKYPKLTMVVDLEQPYSSFARAMIDKVIYPDLIDEKGQPIPPYDVTAHNLALLNGADVTELRKRVDFPKFRPGGMGSGGGSCSGTFIFGAYRSPSPSMDEGWTRWVFETEESRIKNRAQGACEVIQRSASVPGMFDQQFNTIVFPDQSPDDILNGYKEGEMPEELVGGIGREGVEKLKKFVAEGGTLVFLNRSSDFAIEQFDLPVVNIAKDWPRKDFYIPGSILKTELDTNHRIADGMNRYSIAWFERSPVFELKMNEVQTVFARVIAKYPDNPKEILLSGWALGKEKMAGKAALVEVRMGRGKVVLFGFRPQYRGQSTATYPLLFNAIAY